MTPLFLLMTRRKYQRLSHLRTAGFLLIMSLAMAAHGEETRAQALLLGGSFERLPVQRFLPGSKRTVLFPARVGRNGEITPLDRAPEIGAGSWDLFLKQARERSALLLATLDPVMVRDARGVVQMAVIGSDDPMTASCILAPDFLQRFSAVFGPELVVAIPARNKVYVFPGLANKIPDISRSIRDDYLISPMPVSTELFGISKKGIRAIGEVEPND
jgi:hypothetical protein